jgi:hypothetical protein
VALEVSSNMSDVRVASSHHVVHNSFHEYLYLVLFMYEREESSELASELKNTSNRLCEEVTPLKQTRQDMTYSIDAACIIHVSILDCFSSNAGQSSDMQPPVFRFKTSDEHT